MNDKSMPQPLRHTGDLILDPAESGFAPDPALIAAYIRSVCCDALIYEHYRPVKIVFQ